MLIGDRWKVESDEHNVTLYKKYRSKNTGLDYWDVQGYYSSIKEAMDALVEKRIMGAGLEDFREVVQRQEGLHRLIEGIFVTSQA